MDSKSISVLRGGTVNIQVDKSTQTQPISDDQELAKALAGIADDPTPEPSTDSTTGSMQFEETPTAPPAAATPVSDAASSLPTPDPAPTPPAPTAAPQSIAPAPSGDLDNIKNEALGELRPLIDHVDLPAEEKFDTYLLLIRSTDDASLIGPAHSAAQGIADEKKKAEALLNIIKEIDYLTHKNQTPGA